MISIDAIIQVIGSTIAARDPYTVDHQQRVTQLACLIASEMDLPEGQERTPAPTWLHSTPLTFTLAIPSVVPSTQLISDLSNPYPAHHLSRDHFEHREMVIPCTSK